MVINKIKNHHGTMGRNGKKREEIWGYVLNDDDMMK